MGEITTLGHTVEVFHTFTDQVPDPKDLSKKVEAKILCVIDSEDSICLVEVGEEGAPCKKFDFTTPRDSEVGPRPSNSLDYTPSGVCTAQIE